MIDSRPHFPFSRQTAHDRGKGDSVLKGVAKALASAGLTVLVFTGLTNCGGKADGGSTDGKCPPQTSPALNCSNGASPANPVITTFTTDEGWCTSSGKWGTTGNLVGSVFSYKGTATGTMVNHNVVGGALHLTGDVMVADYAGGGLAFDACVNTSTYSGVQFVMGGNAAGCSVQFQLQTYSQQASENRGGCVQDAGSCYQFPKFSLPASGGEITVRWTDLESTGMPATARQIAAEIVGLQFQLQADTGVACTAFDLTFDDVKFIP